MIEKFYLNMTTKPNAGAEYEKRISKQNANALATLNDYLNEEGGRILVQESIATVDGQEMFFVVWKPDQQEASETTSE